MELNLGSSGGILISPNWEGLVTLQDKEAAPAGQMSETAQRGAGGSAVH